MSTEASFWEKLSALSSLWLVLIAIFALGFTDRQIKEARDEARIQHLAEVLRQFEQPPLIDSWKAVARNRIDTKQHSLRPLDLDDPPEAMYEVLGFFEYVGLLEKRGYLDAEDVWDQFGYTMFNFYADARPLIDMEQKENKAIFSNFSSLMNKVRDIELRRSGGVLDHPSADDIYAFYATEAEAPPGSTPGRSRKKEK